MNEMTESWVLTEDKLFATLDATVRKLSLKNHDVLLSDTVGFIRKLPHHLIESFKSTLDEVRDADILLHVVDASGRMIEEYIEDRKSTRLNSSHVAISYAVFCLKKKRQAGD